MLVNDVHVNGVLPPLEDRLASAQTEGLEPNVRRMLRFVDVHGPIEFQALGVRRNPGSSFEIARAAHARTVKEAIALCNEAEQLPCHGVYVLPALLRPGVETRHSTPGRWFDQPKGGSTTDSDVRSRHVLAWDFDVERATKISATDDEMAASVTAAQRGWLYLAETLGEGALALVHSGNGRQIWIALDAIPADDEVKLLLASLLTGASVLFSSGAIKFDAKLFDAKRILPACGTTKKKGAPGIADRPHRRTAIVVPDVVQRIALDQLRELHARIRQDCNEAGKSAMDKALGIKSSPGPAKAGTRSTDAESPERSESPFDVANALDKNEVADWLGLTESGDLRCPGCGSSEGVAILDYGLYCHHDRCSKRGVNGFRSNLDLAMEVHGVDVRGAYGLLADKFELPALSSRKAESMATAPPPELEELPRIGALLEPTIARSKRRVAQIEKPIPLPFPSVAAHYGGGLWPGLHFLNAGTGKGKTQIGLQTALHAAKLGFPVLYIGLELEGFQIGCRLLGEEGGVPWSALYLGKAGPAYMDRAEQAIPALRDLPFHYELGRPRGWPVSRLHTLGEALRVKYPQGDVPGSRPALVVLDFLQIVGADSGERRSLELRERIGDAAYSCRDLASRLDLSVLVISSIARDKVKTLTSLTTEAALTWETGADGIPVARTIGNPDALVGLGKESGDIEYSGDSVSALIPVANTWREGIGRDFIFATPKGRATGDAWSPLLFTGFRFLEPEDRGRRVVDAFATAKERKTKAKAEQAEAKEQEKIDQTREDVLAVVRFVLEHPGCSEREAKSTVNRTPSRWKRVQGALGEALDVDKTGSDAHAVTIKLNRAPAWVREELEP